MSFADYLAATREQVDRFLDRALPPADAPPPELHEAIRYTVFAGGKRFRPVLAYTTGMALGASEGQLLPAAAALELIHVSSLIHDDLPCMDDADTRRGKPSCHKVFGEATAVLAGDWLLVFPYELLARETALGNLSPDVAAALMGELSRAVGSSGIVAGQILDLRAETVDIGPEELETIHELKTAVLIEACARVGAAVARAPADLTSAVARSARALGMCFQAVDDILDVVGDAASLGKPTGADVERRKATHIGFCGLESAQQRAEGLARAAHEALAPLPPSEWLERLHALIEFVVRRTS